MEGSRAEGLSAEEMESKLQVTTYATYVNQLMLDWTYRHTFTSLKVHNLQVRM